VTTARSCAGREHTIPQEREHLELLGHGMETVPEGVRRRGTERNGCKHSTHAKQKERAAAPTHRYRSEQEHYSEDGQDIHEHERIPQGKWDVVDVMGALIECRPAGSATRWAGGTPSTGRPG